MSAGKEQATAPGPRKVISRETMVAISPLPPPEEVSADWLISVPPCISIEMAARRQIAAIDTRDLIHPDLQVLRTLMAAVAGRGAWSRPGFNP